MYVCVCWVCCVRSAAVGLLAADRPEPRRPARPRDRASLQDGPQEVRGHRARVDAKVRAVSTPADLLCSPHPTLATHSLAAALCVTRALYALDYRTSHRFASLLPSLLTLILFTFHSLLSPLFSLLFPLSSLILCAN